MVVRRLAALASTLLIALTATSPTTRAQAGGSISLTALDARVNARIRHPGAERDVEHVAGRMGARSRPEPTPTRRPRGGPAAATWATRTASAPLRATERAFGGVQSGALVPFVGALFTNNTGETITSLEIDYIGEQWRLGTLDRVGRLDVQYRLDATSLMTGIWVGVQPSPSRADDRRPGRPLRRQPRQSDDGRRRHRRADVAPGDTVRDPVDGRQRQRRRRRARNGRLHGDRRTGAAHHDFDQPTFRSPRALPAR